MSDSFNPKEYANPNGGYVRLSRNVTDKSEAEAKTERSVFIKIKESSSYVTTFSTLSLDQARDFRAHLDTLIEEVEALLPKPQTKAEFAKALPEGTLFSNSSVEFIRLDGNKVYTKLFGEIRDIDEYFAHGPNGTSYATTLKLGPVVK